MKYIWEIKPDHVISCYIHPLDRIKFANFRNSMKKVCFHSIPFFYPESRIKRLLKFSEYFLFPYNGKIFCISKRQYDYLKKIAKNCVFLLPPVPEEFFLKPEEKPINDKIKVAYVGRIDPRKGIKEVIEIFQSLKNDKRFDFAIYGIHIPSDREGLEIHNWLENQKKIKYVSFERHSYSEDIEYKLREILRRTDLIILPYKSLDSTIDTPLLLLEARASLCIVLTTNVGSLPYLHNKNFLMRHTSHFVKFLKNISYKDILQQRVVLYNENNFCQFNLTKTVENFAASIFKNI